MNLVNREKISIEIGPIIRMVSVIRRKNFGLAMKTFICWQITKIIHCALNLKISKAINGKCLCQSLFVNFLWTEQDLLTCFPHLYIHRYAQYSHFKIYSEADYYKLEIDGYEGNAGDSLNDPWYGSNNSPFSTYNRDNDRSSLNCASMLKVIYYPLFGLMSAFIHKNFFKWNFFFFGFC